nr:hypothetical protein [Tanacetum cinerariifolium]GEZ88276.1 hypothetical protein [Tanacetum cinerariifolium]
HDEDYHSIKDDTPLASIYSTWNVLFRGMRYPDAFLIAEIYATDDYKESYATEFSDSMLNDDVDDSDTRIEPGSYKENPKVVVDENVSKKTDDKKDDDEVNDDDVKKTNEVAEENENDDHTLVGTRATSSMETRNEQMHTPIPTPTRSPRKNLSSDKFF